MTQDAHVPDICDVQKIDAEPTIAASYEVWYQNTGRRTDRLEKELLRKLLNGFPAARTLLAVGLWNQGCDFE